MDKRIKYIIWYGIILLIIVSLSFTLFVDNKDYLKYALIWLVIFILPSVLIYFSSLKAFDRRKISSINKTKPELKNKFGWFIFILIFVIISLLSFSTRYNLPSAFFFSGIFVIFFIFDLYFGFLIYSFFIKKKPIIPLISANINFYYEKPFQYFYIILVIIVFISLLVITFGFLMNTLFGWTF